MLDPWTHALGSEQGRITPSDFSAYEGDHVLCLGSDVAGVKLALKADDKVEVAQTGEVPTGATMLRLRARSRGPTLLPQLVEVTSSVTGDYTVAIDTESYTYSADVADGVVAIAAALAALVNADADALMSAHLVGDGSFIQLESVDAEETPLVELTGELSHHTVWWELSVEVGSIGHVLQRVEVGRNRDRLDLGALVRAEEQAGGDHTITLRLQLKGSSADTIAEVELPGVWIDLLTLEAE